jgi:hypothetical protein
MTTRIGSSPSTGGVAVLATATRVTPDPGHPFNAVLRSGASAVMRGAQSAITQLPGGEVLAAAVRQPSDSGLAGPGSSLGRAGAASGVNSSATLNTNANPAQAADGGGIEGALSRQAEDNLYYLGLQQQIQDENRYFSTVSNVLKARHDTVKNSIGNLR